MRGRRDSFNNWNLGREKKLGGKQLSKGGAYEKNEEKKETEQEATRCLSRLERESTGREEIKTNGRGEKQFMDRRKCNYRFDPIEIDATQGGGIKERK